MSVVGGGGGGGSLGASLGTGTGVTAVAAAGPVGVGKGCEEDDGGFKGEEPGLGGSEGWICEVPFIVVGRGIGNVDDGTSAVTEGSGTFDDDAFAVLSGADEAIAASR